MRAPSTVNGSAGSPGSPGQQSAHTPVAVTATDAPTAPIGTRVMTRLVAGSMRTIPTPGTAPQTMPAPTVILRRQVATDRPVPTTLATTWLLRGSTRETSQRAAQTASGPTAIALTSSHGGNWTRPGSGMLATSGREAVSGPAVSVTGDSAARRLPLVRRPTATRTIMSAATPTMVAAGLRDDLLIWPPCGPAAQVLIPMVEPMSKGGALC